MGLLEYPGMGGHAPSSARYGMTADTNQPAMKGLGYADDILYLADYEQSHGFPLRCLAI